MTNTEKILAGLLAVSIVMNVVNFFNIDELSEEQFFYANKNEVQNVQNEVSRLYGEIEKLAEQGKWIQDEIFQLDPKSSDWDKVTLESQWTFKELPSDHKPFLLLREEGEDWIEKPLEHVAGLTYGSILELSPQSNYEYQIVIKGDLMKSSDAQWIPRKFYGIPELEMKYGREDSSEGKAFFQFEAFYGEGFPMESMRIDNFYLEVLKNGEFVEKIPFTDEKEGQYWRGEWKVDNSNLEDYVINSVTEYSNGKEVRKNNVVSLGW
ncbi:hypothetical protein RZN22_18065 [Bacillaceae bacterium S4-13-58]